MNFKTNSTLSLISTISLTLVFTLSVFSQSTGYKEKLANAKTAKDSAYVLIDIAYDYLSEDPPKSRIHSSELLKMAERNDWIKLKASAYGLIGLYHEALGNYDEAISQHQNAVEVLLVHDSLKRYLQIPYANLATAFHYSENFSSALVYRKKCLSIAREFGNTYNEAMTYMGMGNSYQRLNQLDSSTYYMQRALELIPEDDLDSRALISANLGDVYLKSKNYPKAWESYFFNYQHLKSDSNASTLQKMDAEFDLAEYFLATSQAQKAKKHLDSVKVAATVLQNREYMVDLLKLYSQYYQQLNDPSRALDYFKQYHILSDSVHGESVQAKIADLHSDFEVTRRELEISNLKNSSALKDITIERKREESIYFAILALLAALLLVVTLFFMRRYKTQSNELKKSNVLIKQKHKEIEYLMRESHHRIKNNLQVVSSLLRMQRKNAQTDVTRQALDEAYSRIRTIAMMHQNLQGGDTFKKIQLHEFITQLSDNILQSMTDKDSGIKISTKLDQLEMDTDKSIAVGLIINELVTNSLKYAIFENPANIKIELTKHSNVLHLNVSDNGPGFPTEFDPAESNSIGFKIINSLTTKLKAELTVTNQNGALVQITIPYDQAA